MADKNDKGPYVSRGGLKMEGALLDFGYSPQGQVCLDVGASTGGFTDCLLQKGAKKVYALDVGYGQLAWKLRQDPRVVVIERQNIRHWDGAQLVDPVDLVVIDVSFISLTLVLPRILECVAAVTRKDFHLLALIKPNFEVGREHVGKKGVVRDPALHRMACEKISSFVNLIPGAEVLRLTDSPLTGPEGNREFFLLARISPSA